MKVINAKGEYTIVMGAFYVVHWPDSSSSYLVYAGQPHVGELMDDIDAHGNPWDAKVYRIVPEKEGPDKGGANVDYSPHHDKFSAPWGKQQLVELMTVEERQEWVAGGRYVDHCDAPVLE